MKSIYHDEIAKAVSSIFSDLLYFRNEKEISNQVKNDEVNQILDGFEIVLKHMRKNARPDEIKDLRFYATIFGACDILENLEEDLKNEIN